MTPKTTRPPFPCAGKVAANSEALDPAKIPQPSRYRKRITRRAVAAEFVFLLAAKERAR